MSPEDLYKVDASKLESLAEENKALNEQIARLEQEREKEPVSKRVSELSSLSGNSYGRCLKWANR